MHASMPKFIMIPALLALLGCATAPSSPQLAGGAGRPAGSNGNQDALLKTAKPELLEVGYRPRIVERQLLYCKTEYPTGSRLPIEACRTEAEIEQLRKENQQLTDQLDDRSTNCRTAGGCR